MLVRYFCKLLSSFTRSREPRSRTAGSDRVTAGTAVASPCTAVPASQNFPRAIRDPRCVITPDFMRQQLNEYRPTLRCRVEATEGIYELWAESWTFTPKGGSGERIDVYCIETLRWLELERQWRNEGTVTA